MTFVLGAAFLVLEIREFANMIAQGATPQMGVHLVFFLHITTGPDNTNNVLALAFGILIALLVLAGSLWIMGDLHANMMLSPRLSDPPMQH